MATSAKSFRLADCRGGGEHGLELQVGKPECRGFGWHGGLPHVPGGASGGIAAAPWMLSWDITGRFA